MATSVLIQLAEALAAELNGASFTMAFTAVRAYQPAVTLADLADLHVTVVPRSLEAGIAARRHTEVEVALDIGVQKKVDPSDRDALDALIVLVEEIGGFLKFRRLAAFPGAAWVALSHDPILAREHLEQHRVFTSLLTATYRLHVHSD